MKTNIKVLSGVLLTLMLSLGIASAGGGSGSVNATYSLIPAGIGVLCAPNVFPAWNVIQQTATICTATANYTGDNAVFATSSSGGAFPFGNTCSLASGSCNVTYTDTNAGIPIINASFIGDGITYGANIEATNVTVSPLVCGLSVNATSLDLSGGAIRGMNIINTGNINESIYVSGSDWSAQAGSVGWTMWGLGAIPNIPMSYNSTMAIVSLTNSSIGQVMNISAAFPPTIPSGTYSATITLGSGC